MLNRLFGRGGKGASLRPPDASGRGANVGGGAGCTVDERKRSVFSLILCLIISLRMGHSVLECNEGVAGQSSGQRTLQRPMMRYRPGRRRNLEAVSDWKRAKHAVADLNAN